MLMSGEYDVVAVVPRNSDMFHRACELNIDIICLDPNRRNDLRQATIRSIIARGVYFEVCVSSPTRSTLIKYEIIVCNFYHNNILRNYEIIVGQLNFVK